MIVDRIYQEDLAYIQSAGFGGMAREAAPEIVRLLRDASVRVRRVVDVGCGAGPMTRALVDAGFEVTGIDTSAELLAIAQADVPEARFIHGSVYGVEMPPCEAIVALGEPLTYHEDGADAGARVAGFFRKASEVLPVGGMLIFDVIETGTPSLAGRFWSSGEDWAVLAETGEDQAARTLVRKIETFRRVGDLYRRGCEVHRVRLFDTAVLLDQLAQSGFATLTAQEYGEQKLGPRRRAFFATLEHHA